jgi:hypothetical protein
MIAPVCVRVRGILCMEDFRPRAQRCVVSDPAVGSIDDSGTLADFGVALGTCAGPLRLSRRRSQ